MRSDYEGLGRFLLWLSIAGGLGLLLAMWLGSVV